MRRKLNWQIFYLNKNMADIKLIDPFTNISLQPLPIADQSNSATFLSNLRALNVGDGGANVFRSDKAGIWLGAAKYNEAPFRVSMEGKVVASSVTVTGVITATAGSSIAAGYITGTITAEQIQSIAATQITGQLTASQIQSIAANQITGTITASQIASIAATQITGTITASQIQSIAATQITGQLTSSQITSITAGQITGYITSSQISSVNATAITGYITSSQISSVSAGSITGTITSSQIGSVSASTITGSITAGQIQSITAGQITGQITASQITNLTITADKIANLTITASQIANSTINDGKIISMSASKLTVGTIDASIINVTNINASNIKSGTLSVGGSNQPSAIVIAQGTIADSAKIYWVGGSRMWSDSSNRIGINSVGGSMYFYMNSSETVIFFQSAQAVFNVGVSCRGALNVGLSASPQQARFTDRVKLYRSGETQYIDSTYNAIRAYTDYVVYFYRSGTLTHSFGYNYWCYGNIYADGTKYFSIPHPDGSDRTLQYAAQESPDVVLRTRGMVTLDDTGKAEIVPPAHFILVTEPKGEVTVNLTSMAEDQNLFVKNVHKNEKVVVNGKPNTSFMYEILAIRKGYLNAPVEIPNDSEDNFVAKVKREGQLQSDQDRKEYADKVKEGKIKVA